MAVPGARTGRVRTVGVKSMIKRALQKMGEVLISLGTRTRSADASASPKAGSRQRQHFEQRSRRLIEARKDRAPVLAGAIQLIGLSEMKQALGAAWANVAQEAYGIAERIIPTHLAETDVCQKYDDETYIICFADLDKASSERKAKRIVDDIKAALLEAASEVRHLRVDHSVTELAWADVQYTDAPLIDVLADSLKKVREEVEAARRTWHDTLLRDASIVFSPVWNARNQTILMYRCLLDDLTGKTTLRRIATLSDPEEMHSTLADLDCIILSRAVAALHDLLQKEEKAMSLIPVNFATLNDKACRDSYLRLCKDMPAPYRQYILFEIHGITAGVPTTRVAELMQYLQPHCKAVVLEAPLNEGRLGQLDGTGIFGISVQLHQPLDGEAATRLAKCVAAAHAHKLHTLAHGADTMGLARAAVKVGVDYIGGKAIAPPTDRLRSAHHWVPPYAGDLKQAG